MLARFRGLGVLAALSLAAAVLVAWPASASAYSYTGTWLGSSYALTHVTNVTVEGLPDSFVVGTITDFQTSDPAYSCLDGQTINVFLAPQEFPGVYVVHDGLQGSMCAYGTWTFSSNYSYTGTWNGTAYSLTRVENVTVEGLPDAQLITNDSTGAAVQFTNFQTSDPSEQCLDGNSINVFMAQDEFPGQHVVHDGLQGSMCTYGTWLFMPVSHYAITIQSWIPQAQTWDPDTSTLCVAVDNYCPYPTYLLESALGPVASCYTPNPLLAASTVVYGLFTGDNHVGYAGTFRTQTVINFNWNPASRTITNYTTSMQHGLSTVTLQYWLTLLGIPVEELDQCSESSTNGLQIPASAASSPSFITGTSGYDPFATGAVALGAVIGGTLWGSFNPNGTLSLSWETTAFPSLGVQVAANQGYDSDQLQQVTNNVSGWDPTSFTGITDVGLALNAWNALTYTSNYGTVLDPLSPVGFPPVTGSTTLNPAP
jgi:hypothetical protein